jgi:tRNA (cmo5U34)-methyltransferase
MVTKAFPLLHIHLTDISEAMLLKAQQRFANNPLVTYAVQEHLQLSAISEYDLILSALSIHHLEHPDKQDLFRKIYCALRPGGVFINADHALAPTPHGEDEYERQWLMDVKSPVFQGRPWSRHERGCARIEMHCYPTN